MLYHLENFFCLYKVIGKMLLGLLNILSRIFYIKIDADIITDNAEIIIETVVTSIVKYLN